MWLIALSCALWLASLSIIWWALWIYGLIRHQHEINEALADYVSADLLKTWEDSAQVLVNKIRNPGK